MAERVFLIDGSNHAFRVFFAMPKMTSRSENTGALLGFANMLRMLEQTYKPDYIVVAFDAGPSFRVDLYPDYKGHRPEMPPELREQWGKLQELTDAWGYPCLTVEGLEADDIIGTLARRWAGPEREVWLVTGDKDFAQLVNENVRILDVMKSRELGVAEVTERFGVPPEKVVDLMGLWGDTSDNVPGVPGIGEKTARDLLQKYGSMDALLAQADTIKGKRGQNLRDFADQARLSRELVTIKTDADFPLSLEDVAGKQKDVARLREMFMRWQFRTHLNQLDDDAPPPPTIDSEAYRAVRSLEELKTVVASIRAAGRLAFDTETTSLDPLEAKLVGLCLCWGPAPAQAVYVPVGHEDALGTRIKNQLSEAEAMELLAPLLADPALPKLGQNLKYDLRVMESCGYTLAGIAGDTMLLDYVLEPERNHHGLDDLALRYLGHKMIPYKEALGGDPKTVPFSQAPLHLAIPYGAEDAHVSWLLETELAERLAERRLGPVYRDLELPLIPILARMESAGIGVDVESLKALSVELDGRIHKLEEALYESAGKRFNLASTKQLRELLFDDLGLEATKKTAKGGQASTDADTLEQLRDQHPFPGLLLDWRALTKLKSTYVDALPAAVSRVTGRIHTSFHQAVAATGRLASNNPNLQNIPIRTEEGRRIRACFIAKPGHVFLSCDYSQVELRLLAHYCKEGALLTAFKEGADIHRRTAAEVFGVAADAVTPDQRSAAKAINFGIIYGMSAFRLAKQLKISKTEAQEYIDGYFARAPQVRGVIERFIAEAQDSGYATTLWGRQRPVVGLSSRNFRDRSAAERIAVNTPIQGSAADLIKLAMQRVARRLDADARDATLLLQVHDELVLEVPEGRVEAVAAMVREEMEGAASLEVPLKVDCGWGRTWDAAH
jgi:DNA polymerase-1